MVDSNEEKVVHYPLIKAHIFISIAYAILVVLAGLTYSLQFIDLYPFPKFEFLSPARVRMVHTQSVAYAWLANVFFGIMMYYVPKLTRKPILSIKFGWFCFWVYNALVVGTVVLILGGYAQALEWGRLQRFLTPLSL